MVCCGKYIFFPSLNFPPLSIFVSWDCFGELDMSSSLPSDKLFDIQQLANSLLKNQPVTVCQIMSFLSKAYFCANGHVQCCQLCCVIESDMLIMYHSPVHLFHSFLFQLCISFRECLPCDFLFLMWLSLWMLCPVPLSFIGTW